MQVRDIMSRDIAWCTADTPLRDVARLMVDFDCGAIPVVDNRSRRKLIGVITDRDITCRGVAFGKNPLELAARDCMSGDVTGIRPESSLDECVLAMERKQVRRLPVVDENGICRGMISQADIARHASQRETAELVCEVSQPA